MSAALRVVVNAGAGAVLVGTLALGAAWFRDRSRHWEAPRWPSAGFVAVRREGTGAVAGGGTWVAVVNPRCARCVATLRGLHDRWRRAARGERLVVLIVDAPGRPVADLLRGIPPLPVWWDRDGLWRRRWGHRLYGELIEFDAAGRWVRTIAGERAFRGARPPVPRDRKAPATLVEGGT